jgi:hypothetical protein
VKSPPPSFEKRSKTLLFYASGNIAAMAAIVEVAEEQKSFAPFLQKRRLFFLLEKQQP